MRMKSIVISGGDGFIGSHLSQHLSTYGYDIYAIVFPGSECKERLKNMPNVHMVEGEMQDYRKLACSLPEKPLAFFHFAWAGVTPDLRNDFDYQMHNIELSTNAVRLASEIKAQKFIFPGSTMEYLYYGKPIDKDAIPSPSNAYAVAKISARYACSVLCKELRMSFVYTVISGIYSEDRNDNNVIYYTIDELLNNRKPSLTKLEQLWDYVHIDDVVRGLRLIAEKGKADAFYALGHGDNWPLSKYIYIIRDTINPDLPLGIGDIPYTNSDIMPCSCVNLEPIFQDTGYIPRISFDEGIARAISEIRKRKIPD